MRVAIHCGMWGAVPFFFLVLALGAVSCFMAAVWFARRGAQSCAVPRFVGWVCASAVCIFGGLTLVGMMPVTAGDGP